MKKRLRKKLHKGEFQEFGFTFEIKFNGKQDSEIIEKFLQDFVAVLEANGLEMVGGWNTENCSGFVTRDKGSVTPEQREMVKAWFVQQGQEIANCTVGELRDAWYSWKF